MQTRANDATETQKEIDLVVSQITKLQATTGPKLSAMTPATAKPMEPNQKNLLDKLINIERLPKNDHTKSKQLGDARAALDMLVTYKIKSPGMDKT